MRSGFTVKQLLVLLAALCAPAFGFAQGGLPQGLHAGIDVTKPLFMRAAILEPVLKYRTNTAVVFSVTYGFCSLSRDSVFSNVAYQNKGNYLKPGIEFVFPKDYISFGLSYLYAGYTEKGHSLLHGPYFGDKHIQYTRQLRTHGLEGNINAYLPLTSRLSVQITARVISVRNHVKKGERPEVPVFYAPGAGRIYEEGPPGQATTFGLNAGLVFNLTPSKSE